MLFRSWRESGLACVPVTVSISSLQLLDGDFVPMLERELARFAISPGLLMLGLEERTITDAATQELELLARIARLGPRLAVEHFGVDHCPLVRLQQAAIKRLALHRRLLANVPADQEAATLVAAIIALAHTLGLTVLADGVEQEDQLVFLRAHGCDQGQGPQLGPPLPLDKVSSVMQSAAMGG